MEVKIKNISFRQYVALEDRTLYDFYLEYGKIEPRDIFKLGSFMDKTFGFVKDIQFYFVYDKKGFTWSAFFEEMAKETGLTMLELTDRSIFQLNACMLYIKDQIETINNIESDYLGHAPTPEQKAANIDRFNSYGPFLQFDALAGGDLLKIDEIKKLPYSVCFTKLKLEADRAEFQNDYNKIINDKTI